MIKIKELPDWYASIDDIDADNFVAAITVVVQRDNKYYFDGVIAEFLHNRRIPHTIEIALDGDEMTSIARLNYGDEDDASAVYAPFEVESFALLWNENPKSIHGLNGNRITLSMKEGSGKLPFLAVNRLPAFLSIRNGEFVATPDRAFAHLFEDSE